MGTCTTSPVKSADARLASLRAALDNLRKQLRECQESPSPTQHEGQLLGQAKELLKRLGNEVRKTKDETAGYGYDTYGFDLIASQIVGFENDVKYILQNSSSRQDLITKLGGALRPRADLTWFHGTYITFAINILDSGCFKANATGGAGKKFGPGTYLTQIRTTAEAYGECVFGISVAGLNILTARDIPFSLDNPFDQGGLKVRTGADWEGPPEIVLNAFNPCAALTAYAQQNGFDAIEFIESTEGHILILLIDFQVDPTNVIYIKD